MGASPISGPRNVGLSQTEEPRGADILFYCDDDARWRHPDPGRYSNPKAWWDPFNDMVFDDIGREPACRVKGKNSIDAETYTNVMRRRQYSTTQERTATITLCSKSYKNRPHTGFYSINTPPHTWPLFTPDNRRVSVDAFYMLSITVVNQVSLYAFFISRHVSLFRKRHWIFSPANMRPNIQLAQTMKDRHGRWCKHLVSLRVLKAEPPSLP